MMAGPQVAPFEPLVIEGEPAANLVDLVHRSVLANPQFVALQWKPPRNRRKSAEGDRDEAVGWRTSTYRETWDWIRDVSLGLQSLGVVSGDTVCLVCRTRPEWLVVDLASMALGAVTCPIYPSSEAGQAGFIINNVRAKLVVVENAQQATKIESVRAECPTVEKLVVIDEKGMLPAAIMPLDGVVAAVPGTSIDLNRVGGHLHGRVRGEHLGHAARRVDGASGVPEARGAPGQQPGRFDAGRGIGQHGLDHFLIRDCPSELGALQRVTARVLERRSREANARRRDADASRPERGERDFEAIPLLAQPVRFRHEGSLEDELGANGVADPHLPFVPGDPKPGRVALDDECRNGVAAPGAIDRREDDRHLRLLAVRDPDLAARERIALIGPLGQQCQSRGV